MCCASAVPRVVSASLLISTRSDVTPVGRFGFPKTSRIRHRRDFQDILEHGIKAICPHVVLFVRRRVASSVPAGPRFGLIVSRKVGESVTRNRVKRRLRESFRTMRPDLMKYPEISELDFVVVARHSASDLATSQLAAALSQCFARLMRNLGEKGR